MSPTPIRSPAKAEALVIPCATSDCCVPKLVMALVVIALDGNDTGSSAGGAATRVTGGSAVMVTLFSNFYGICAQRRCTNVEVDVLSGNVQCNSGARSYGCGKSMRVEIDLAAAGRNHGNAGRDGSWRRRIGWARWCTHQGADRQALAPLLTHSQWRRGLIVPALVLLLRSKILPGLACNVWLPFTVNAPVVSVTEIEPLVVEMLFKFVELADSRVNDPTVIGWVPTPTIKALLALLIFTNPVVASPGVDNGLKVTFAALIESGVVAVPMLP